MKATAMIAMGGNSISPKEKIGTISEQFANTRKTIDALSHFINLDYNLCINHGNGPQVGNELMRMDLTFDKLPPLPLGVCVAGTQGSIGYMVQQYKRQEAMEATYQKLNPFSSIHSPLEDHYHGLYTNYNLNL
jgi:carbamate kinase